MPETEESLSALRSFLQIIEEENKTKKSKPRKSFEKDPTMEIRTIQNNLDFPCQQDNETLAILSKFRQIICIQLPEIPKEYVSRLIFDDRHLNHVLLEHDVGVRGGICCRKFENFLELAFCAVTTSEQLKGYGTLLMDFLKNWMVEQGIFHVITYADENAKEWFRKKGFTETPQLDPKFYKNRIKEYEGATLMGFDIDAEYLIQKYPEFAKRLQLLETIMEKDLEEKSSSESDFRLYRGIETVFKGGPLPLSVSQIPGTRDFEISKNPQYQLEPIDSELDSKIAWILEQLEKESSSRPFREPVDRKMVPDYYTFIQNPIDLKTMKEKFQKKYYCHQHLFIADLTRMFHNCYTFNGENTVYYRYGYKLNELALIFLKSAFPEAKMYPELPEKKPQFYI